MRKKIFLLFGLFACACALHATTAAKGVFSVSSTKTVQFANAPESDLVLWSTASSHASADENGWRVLNHDEWTYLLSSGRAYAADLNNLGTVAGDSGLIILPDGWIQPDGVPTFKPVDLGIHYDKNIYTAAQWSVMEQSGAVFLPCQGYKEGDVVQDAKTHGAYWSSDQYNDLQGYSVHFNDGEIHDQNTFASKSLYYSIILVREVPSTFLDEQDYSAAFGTKLGTADDYNFAFVKRTLKKDSTLYTLCLPFDVPNIDASPLVGADVYEFAGGTVGGSQGNEVLYLNLTRLSGKRLTQGVPYLLRWEKTTPTIQQIDTLRFYNVENWDNNTTTADDPGNGIVNFHGVYPKAHIPGYTSGSVAHYNFFLGANNTLYWPDDTTYPEGTDHDMKGFRAYFYINDYPFSAPSRHSMQTVWNISGGFGAATGIQNTDRFTDRVQTEKLMRDGQIILIIDGKEFDLQGKQIK